MKKIFAEITLIIILFLLISSILFFLKNTISELKPNVVIISIDALRPDHTSVYGYTKDTTPNLNALAQKSFIFTNFRTVIPMTYPSFVALMTGKQPLSSRIIHNNSFILSDNNKTLATYLKDDGYKTAGFLTGALNPNSTNFNRSIDDFDYQSFKTYTFTDSNEVYHQSDRQSYEEFIANANDWVTKNKNQKFFLWLHLMDPHAPYQPTDNLKCQFGPEFCSYILSKSDAGLEEERSSLQKCQKVPIPEDKIKLFETLYDGGVAYSDRLAGMVFDNLKKNNLDKNTIVIIYSDHGEGFDHNYYFNHREVLYDSSLKTVLIIKTPDSNSHQNISQPIQNDQVLSTLLDYLKIKYDKNSEQGISFSNLLTKNPLNFLTINKFSKYSFFYNSNLTKFAIFDGKYKYIYSLPESCLLNNQANELYDLSTDPKEENNLYFSNKEAGAKLKENLLRYLSNYNLPPKIKSPDQQQNNQYNLPY